MKLCGFYTIHMSELSCVKMFGKKTKLENDNFGCFHDICEMCGDSGDKILSDCPKLPDLGVLDLLIFC